MRVRMMATNDPSKFDVLFVLFGHERSLDPSAFTAALGAALEPYYALPFAPVSQMDAPRWQAVERFIPPTPEESEMVGGRRVISGGGAPQAFNVYVASSGALATRLSDEARAAMSEAPPPEDAAGAAEYDRLNAGAERAIAGRLEFARPFQFVTGVRWVLQQRRPTEAAPSRRSAISALRAGPVASFARDLSGSTIDLSIIPYAARAIYPLQALPFPSTPSLPGGGAAYRNGALFAIFGGAALGAAMLAGVLNKREA